jgi:hypothetical protein
MQLIKCFQGIDEIEKIYLLIYWLISRLCAFVDRVSGCFTKLDRQFIGRCKYNTTQRSSSFDSLLLQFSSFSRKRLTWYLTIKWLTSNCTKYWILFTSSSDSYRCYQRRNVPAWQFSKVSIILTAPFISYFFFFFFDDFLPLYKWSTKHS